MSNPMVPLGQLAAISVAPHCNHDIYEEVSDQYGNLYYMRVQVSFKQKKLVAYYCEVANTIFIYDRLMSNYGETYLGEL